jgi:hypothetical protein
MKVAFIDVDILNEQIIEDNGQIIENNGQQVQSLPLYIWAATQDGWGIDSDIDGVKSLTLDRCCTGTPYTIKVTDGVTQRVIKNVEFIGGRPPVVR